MRRRRRAGEGGFTLTELLVALTVTIIGLAGLLSLHVTTVRGNASAGKAAEAVVVAEQQIEDLRSSTVLALESSPFTPITTTEQSVVGTAVPARNGQLYWPALFAQDLGPASGGLVRFRVVVYWMDDGAEVANAPTPSAADLATSDHAVEFHFVRTRVEVL